MPEIEHAVIEALVLKAESLIGTIAQQKEVSPVKPGVLKLQHQIEQLQALAATMGDDDGLFSQKVRRIEQQLAMLQAQPVNTIARETLKERLKPLADRRCWDQMTTEELRACFVWFVDKVMIADGQITDVLLNHLLQS